MIRIGIAVGHGAVRAVALRSNAVHWTAEREVESLDALPSAITELMAVVSHPRWRRSSATVAVGPSLAQARRITGLPAIPDPEALAQVVQESAGRLFLRNGSPLVTSGVHLVEPGVVWAAAFESPLLAAIETGCRAARLRLRAIVPAVVALRGALEGERFRWTDGPVSAEVELRDGRLSAVRRAVCLATAESEVPRAVRPLARLGEDAVRFADAYGAAVLAADERLVVRPGEREKSRRIVPRWRLLVAGFAATFATSVAVFAPALLALRAGNQAVEQISKLTEERTAAVSAEHELRRISEAVAEVATFDRSRRSMSVLLAELTRYLPDEAAVVTLRVDTAGGTLLSLAPGAAELVTALDALPGVATPEIVGPVTTEIVGGQEFERIMLRFRFTP